MKNASTQTIAETYGNDGIRRLRAVRRRNHIREEMAFRTHCKWCRMWRFRSRCNTVPIEKGTETHGQPSARAEYPCRCNTVPIEKGTETEDR